MSTDSGIPISKVPEGPSPFLVTQAASCTSRRMRSTYGNSVWPCVVSRTLWPNLSNSWTPNSRSKERI